MQLNKQQQLCATQSVLPGILRPEMEEINDSVISNPVQSLNM